ncbi:MAG: shikimate kinase [Oscillospiraceae bacterium]
MKNIILIGMSGAGKSTIGVLLAKALGMTFVDTDLIIQYREGQLLQQILDGRGVDEFLRIEESVLSELEATNTVVATGGSAVYSERAMRHLKSIGDIVYLSVDFSEICRRIKNITTRGIVLINGNSLEDAYNERLPLYKKYADITVECGGGNIEDSVTEIIQLISKNITN